MKRMKKAVLFLVIALMGNHFLNAQTKWVMDKNHTNIRFTAIHYVITEVEGKFKEFEGTVTSNSEDFDGAEVEFAAKVASISTDNERRDNHLKTDDFFNAEKFPDVKFKGIIEKKGKKYFLVGDFSMRDVTKAVKFDVTFNGIADLGERGKKAGFKVIGAIDRFEYGLKYNSVLESGGLAVSQEIQLTCNVELNLSK